jgi:hypothetical protein
MSVVAVIVLTVALGEHFIYRNFRQNPKSPNRRVKKVGHFDFRRFAAW